MVQGTATGSRLGWAIFVCAVVALGAGFLYMTEDPDEATVDLHAAWTPPRDISVSWQIGALISGERFAAEDIGQFNLTLQVPRGTEVVVLVEQGPETGYAECQINVDGQEADRIVVDDGENCRVKAIV